LSTLTLPSWDPKWRRRYNSPPDDLINQFYVPALARSIRYDRAVGFFSSHLLGEIAPSIDEFVMNDGMMRLVTSPANLSDDDLAAMGKGEELRSRLKKDLENSIAGAPIPDEVIRDRLKLITWMVAKGRLEVRIALREHPDCYSLFHEKIGVFIDHEDHWMTFTGSPNETLGGARHHSESFPLHCSWANEDQRAYAEDEKARFDDIWNGLPGVTTWKVNAWMMDPMKTKFGMREASHGTIVRKPPVSPPDEEAKAPVVPAAELSLLPSMPDGLQLHDFQKQAVNDWLLAGGRGTFAMATGTGKTITALAAATQVSGHAAQEDRPLLILVIAPLVDLVGQWRRTAEWFGFRPVICHGGLSKEQRDGLKRAFSAARSARARRSEMVITTADSLTPPSSMDEDPDRHFLQRQLARHKGPLLVIGDEMHSLGTDRRLAALPREPRFTIGLSATPKRHGDETGTRRLLEYFGAAVVSISIKQAIYDHRVLVPYDYFPTRIELTEQESIDYKKISQSIAAAFARGGQEAADPFIRARTRLTQHASNKQPRLRELMAGGLARLTHQIVYVAEGKDPESDLRQLDEVERMLRDEFGMSVERYYGETPHDRREILQQRLASGEVQALLAMKCLDEGVDIPSVRVGIITASTQNPRQFVQRRGRLLRRDPNNPKSHAIIHDFIVMPPAPDSKPSASEQTLIGAELSRAAELADAARNREVLFRIVEWAYNYQLDPGDYPWMQLSLDQEMNEWLT
jgi:superfamily II DNA or RNA helicase